MPWAQSPSSPSRPCHVDGKPWARRLRSGYGCICGRDWKGQMKVLKRHYNPHLISTCKLLHVVSKSNPRLTFWEQSPMLPCCTFGSCHQAVWWRCSWTCGQSWKCRLCKASPLGSGFLLADNPASGPRPIPAGRILSCFPPVSVDRLPYLEAGGSRGNVYFKAKFDATEQQRTLTSWSCISLRIFVIPYGFDD